MDDLVTLRRMLSPGSQGGIAPDEDTALHQALKALIAVFGRKEVSLRMPYKVTYLEKRSIPDVWIIESTGNCPDKKTERCEHGVYRAEVDRWTGDVVRVFSGD
jgi:hypothetical protein